MQPGVVVHRDLGAFSPLDCLRAGRLLNALPHRRLLVQWVPHGYGYKSLNVPFAIWLAWRAWVRGDELHLMVHEPYMRAFWPPAHLAASLVERLMLAIVGTASTRVWLSIATWHDYVAPFVGRRTPVEWLPVPAPVTPVSAAASHEAPPGGAERRPHVVGHFSTFSPVVTALLEPALALALAGSEADVLLIGRDSEAFRDRFVRRYRAFDARVRATGTLDSASLTSRILECDLMLQPYPDGITGRNTSMLVALAFGRPVVSNTGLLTESLWEPSGAALLASGPDPSRLATAVLEALGNASLRAHTGRLGAALYAERFAIHNAVALLNASALGDAPAHPHVASHVHT